MMKMNITKLFMAILGISLLFAQCKSDETTVTVSTLSGKISLSASEIADGSIVSLSSQPLGANVIARTVADAAGMYSFMGLENGTYYINATFEPSNNNNLKSTGTVILTGKEVEVAVSGNTTQDVVMEGMVSDGTANFKLADWTWDNTHSTIGFEFPYDAFNAVFKGNFARAGFDVLEFDEANPTSASIKAWVDVTSVETGAPSGICGHGRDGITGCIQGTFGLDLSVSDTVVLYCEDGGLSHAYPNTELADYDLWGDGSTTTYQKQGAIIGKTGVATFKSKEVLPYGTGYVAKGDFSLNGNTNEVSMYFTYLEGYVKSDGSKEYVSFYGWFEFDAAGDFGISSGHVGDAMVKVSVSAQFNQAIPQ